MTIRVLAGVLAVLAAVALTGAADEPKEKEKSVNEKVVEFCKKHVGKEVGDGECTSLASAALKEAGAKPRSAFEDHPNRGDYVWGEAHEIDDLPAALLERIEHYFSTYKLVPDEPPKIAVIGRYGFADAAAVIRAALEDYREMFPRS